MPMSPKKVEAKKVEHLLMGIKALREGNLGNNLFHLLTYENTKRAWGDKV